MDVNLSSLNTFLKVAKHRGITRALGELHLTQPAVSRQIKGLEDFLETPLFIRKGRFLTLTEAGYILEHYSARIFELLEEAREEIDSLKGLIRGHMRICATTTIGIYMIPDMLAEFKAQHPGIEINLTIANKDEVLRQVQTGMVDMGFAGPPIPFPEFSRHAYMEDDMVLIVSPQHQLAARNTVMGKDLTEDMFILRERGSGIRQVVEEELQRSGVYPTHTMELASTEAIKKTVAANLGVSIVPSRAVILEAMIGNLRAVRVSDLNLRYMNYMVYLPNTPMSSAAEGFRRFLSDRSGKQEKVSRLPARAPDRAGKKRSSGES